VCFLDGRQAFDRVWHDGILYKLIEACVDDTSLLAFKEIYRNIFSYVRNQGYISDIFPILQGTRQGSKSSPMLYLLYINGLINELESSGLGFCMYNSNISSPTVADDMVLISFSKHGLDMMLSICNRYSLKWRFEYNANKCGIIVFNEVNSENLQRIWTLGTQTIHEVDNYTHLGIDCNRFLQLKKSIEDASVKLRGTYFSITNSGLHPNGLSPITFKTIYSSIILPRALYGCELWNNYTDSDIENLEKSHRFCLKTIQSFAMSTSTQYTLAALDMNSIEINVEFRKLTFLGQLCRLPCRYLAKKVFLNRLFSFLNNDRQYVGFIPDSYKLLQKYNLLTVLNNFVITGEFPSKNVWKNMLHKQVLIASKQGRTEALLQQRPGAVNYLPTPCNTSELWSITISAPELRPMCYVVASVIGKTVSRRYTELCPLCSILCENLLDHIMNFCLKLLTPRTSMWNYIINSRGIYFYIRWIMLTRECQLDEILTITLENARDGQFTPLRVMYLLFKDVFKYNQ
jgi:hypothetical protein